MLDASGETTNNIIQVWGLMPDERLKLIAQAQKLIRQGRATDVGTAYHGTYICVYDRHGAPYTIGRENRVLHLLGPGGETISVGATLDMIIKALDYSLQRYN